MYAPSHRALENEFDTIMQDTRAIPKSSTDWLVKKKSE